VAHTLQIIVYSTGSFLFNPRGVSTSLVKSIRWGVSPICRRISD